MMVGEFSLQGSSMFTDFSFSTTSSLVFGKPVAQVLTDLCKRRKIQRILFVTDPGIVQIGLLNTTLAQLEASAISLYVFDQVEADPSDTTVISAAQMAKENSIELVVGFGGGSSMDVAKLVAVLAHPQCTSELSAFYGVDQIHLARLPLIQVPTTAGTGSEVTPISIVTTGGSTKAGVVSEVLQPDVAILDPSLTLGLPPHITAATGIDAMVHAIEAFTSKIRKNPYSDMLAMQALRLLNDNIQTAVKQGSDVEARGNMLLGAMLAGQAFANAPVAGVHALAYPLGGHFHIPHGLSNSLVLPHVLRFNAAHAQHLYAKLAPIFCPDLTLHHDDLYATEMLIEKLEWLITDLGLPDKLRHCGVAEENLELLASEAMLQQRLLVNNPREINQADALAIYQAAF